MNSSPIQLLNAYLDGKELTPAEADYLSGWVKADPANARTVVEMGIIHSQTEYLISIPQFLNELSDSRKLDSACEKALRPTPAPVGAAPVVSAPSRRRRASRRPSRVAVFTAISAALIAAVGLGWLALDDRNVSGDLAERTSSAPDPAPSPVEPVLATVTESVNVSWRSELAARRGLHVRRGDSVEILSGVLALTTATGSDVVLEGPVEAEFLAADRIRVRRGRVTARVDGAVTGLTIETPSAWVVDLGTEFGVGVDRHGATSLAVYEGVVELFGRDRQSGSGNALAPEAMRITSGRSGYVSPEGAVRWTVETLANRREFVRPDEVRSIRQALSGDSTARQQVSFYTLQRTPGLLGFQSFDIPSQGAAYTQAFKRAPVRSERTPTFATDLRREHLYGSGSLQVDAGESVFLDLDTAPDSSLARAGLLTEQGMVGRSDAQLWMAWKARSLDPHDVGDFAGVSLMFGDARPVQEPIFLGAVDGKAEFAVAATLGSMTTTHTLDADPESAVVESQEVTEGVHQWAVRVIFGERSDKVAVWCDTPLAEVADTRPHAEAVHANLMFDRVRLGVGRDGAPWRFDDFCLGADLEAIVRADKLLAGGRPGATRGEAR